MSKYVAWDYENSKTRYYHIYDNDCYGISVSITIEAAENNANAAIIEELCQQIDTAIDKVTV